jgi:hypothetical protein
MSGMQLAEQAACKLQSTARATASKWNRIPIHCSYYCHPVDGESVGQGRRMAWRPACHRVFKAPMLKAPSWITGMLGILLINLN